MLSTSLTLSIDSAKHLTGTPEGAGEILRFAQDDKRRRSE